MATNVISPNIFVEHATRLRARKLEQIAANLHMETHPKLVFKPLVAVAARRDLSSVLRHICSRVR